MENNKLIDLDSESIVIGCMLNSIDIVNNALDRLTVNDFHKLVHRVIFNSIKELYVKDARVDAISVINNIQETDAKFNPVHVFEVNQFGKISDCDYEINKLRELSHMRSLALTLAASSEAVLDKKGSYEDISSKTIHEIEKISSENLTSEQNFEEVMWNDYQGTSKSYIQVLEEKIEERRQGMISYDGVPSFYPLLDEALNGLNRGHFIVVGARPGVGKTTFVLNILKRVCQDNKIPAGFFSLEMSSDQVCLNLAAIHGKLNSHKLRSFQASPQEFSEVVTSINSLKDMPLYIDDQASLRISQIVARTKRWVTTKSIKLLVIDYLTLIQGDTKYINHQEKVSDISKSLRALAKSLKIPIICLCQLNRESEKGNRKPNKADLRESGQIEQDAHSILMLHQVEKFFDPENGSHSSQTELQVLIVKNRFGPALTIDYSFDKSTGFINEYEKMQKE